MMVTSKDKAKTPKRKSKLKNPPEQKLGDTPVAPWDMSTPEEKQKAKPVRQALKQAVAKVDSQAKADQVINKLTEKAADKTARDVEEKQADISTPAQAAKQVKQAIESAPASKKTEKVLETTAETLTSKDKRTREAVSEAVQEVLNPEQQGAPAVADPKQREYLRKAVLKRLTPWEGLDTNLFIAINHLPHTRLLNAIFYGITSIFHGGALWYVFTGLLGLQKRRTMSSLFREVVVPLFITSTLVELPIKGFFRRRRPFITIIQAIVIGKKPGTWSFPSGHSATAFAGASLLNRISPRWHGLRYIVASLVAFSRVYLGDHYPSDVMSGSLVGLLFGRFFAWLMRTRRNK